VRWLGGTLTNFDTIKRSIARLNELDRMKTEGIFKVMSKKETSRLGKEHAKLEKSLEGIKNMKELPGLIFIIDPSEETTTVLEGRKLGIPIVAVCDTNCDPDLIDHPIPGNDDAIRAVKLFCSIVADAVLEGSGLAGKAEQSAEAGEAAETAEAADAQKETTVAGVPAAQINEEISLIPESEVKTNEPIN
jgi:small subunit ribosomal protein S2